MRVVCPSCTAAYEVPERLLGATARALRCARCNTVFAAAAPPAEEERPPPPAAEPPAAPPPLPGPPAAPEEEARFADTPPAPPPPPAQPPPQQRERPGLAPMLAWGASIVAVGGGVVALFAQRAVVVEAWPPAARLFLWLGLG